MDPSWLSFTSMSWKVTESNKSEPKQPILHIFCKHKYTSSPFLWRHPNQKEKFKCDKGSAKKFVSERDARKRSKWQQDIFIHLRLAKGGWPGKLSKKWKTRYLLLFGWRYQMFVLQSKPLTPVPIFDSILFNFVVRKKQKQESSLMDWTE